MPILRAYALPHPPLAVPAVGRGEEQKIQATFLAFDEVARTIAALAPETIIFITPHNVNYADYFHISPGKSAKGSFRRFAAPETHFDVAYDTDLAGEITTLAQNAGPLGEKDAKLDHGVMVPSDPAGDDLETQ